MSEIFSVTFSKGIFATLATVSDSIPRKVTRVAGLVFFRRLLVPKYCYKCQENIPGVVGIKIRFQQRKQNRQHSECMGHWVLFVKKSTERQWKKLKKFGKNLHSLVVRSCHNICYRNGCPMVELRFDGN